MTEPDPVTNLIMYYLFMFQVFSNLFSQFKLMYASHDVFVCLIIYLKQYN